MPSVIATRRGESFSDKNGVPNNRSIVWIEEVTRRVNDANNGLDSIPAIIDRLDELEPNFIVIDNTDSPYQAANNDYILADMSLGDVTVNFPTSGRFSVSRDGADNDLTLNETVSECATPLIRFDKSTATMAKIVNDWRYV